MKTNLCYSKRPTKREMKGYIILLSGEKKNIEPYNHSYCWLLYLMNKVLAAEFHSQKGIMFTTHPFIVERIYTYSIIDVFPNKTFHWELIVMCKSVEQEHIQYICSGSALVQKKKSFVVLTFYFFHAWMSGTTFRNYCCHQPKLSLQCSR